VKKQALTLAAVGYLAFCATANATVVSLFGSLTGTPEDQAPVSPALGGDPAYQSFSTGGRAVTLSELDLVGWVTNLTDGGSMSIALYASNSTAPAASPLDILGTFADSSLTTYLNGFSVPVAGLDIHLAADTRYWIGIYDSSAPGYSSSFVWGERFNNSDTVGATGQYTGIYGQVIPDPYSFFDASNGTTYDFGPMDMGVTGSVPEPATLGLLALGLAGVGFSRRKRRS
jgi:PEP-CTERM motif